MANQKVVEDLKKLSNFGGQSKEEDARRQLEYAKVTLNIDSTGEKFYSVLELMMEDLTSDADIRTCLVVVPTVSIVLSLAIAADRGLYHHDGLKSLFKRISSTDGKNPFVSVRQMFDQGNPLQTKLQGQIEKLMTGVVMAIEGCDKVRKSAKNTKIAPIIDAEFIGEIERILAAEPLPTSAAYRITTIIHKLIPTALPSRIEDASSKVTQESTTKKVLQEIPGLPGAGQKKSTVASTKPPRAPLNKKDDQQNHEPLFRDIPSRKPRRIPKKNKYAFSTIAGAARSLHNLMLFRKCSSETFESLGFDSPGERHSGTPAAPMTTPAFEALVERPCQHTLGHLFKVWSWVVDGREPVRIKFCGHKSTRDASAFRIDGGTFRGREPQSFTPELLGRRDVTLYELKKLMGHSIVRVQVTDRARFKKTNGYTDAIFQCIGRLAQCVELFFGSSGVPEDGAAIIQAMSSFLPRALVIGDSNVFGAVYLRLDTTRLGVPGILPLIVDTTAHACAIPKELSPRTLIHFKDCAAAFSIPLVAQLVSELSERQEVKVVPRGRQKLDFSLQDQDSPSGDDSVAKQTPEKKSEKKSEKGSKNPPRDETGTKKQNLSEAPLNDVEMNSTSRQVVAGTERHAVRVFLNDDVLDDRGHVFQCEVESVTPHCSFAPPWMRPGKVVVIKTDVKQSEMACYRALNGCKGISRHFNLRDSDGGDVLVMADGALSLSMKDWFNCDEFGILRGTLPPPQWIQSITANLYDVVRQLHRRDVVHGDLTAHNILLVATGTGDFDVEPVVIDFDLSVYLKEWTETFLTHHRATMSIRGTKLSLQGATKWSPQPEDDLESVALIAEWLSGNLPNGNNTTVEEKRALLLRAQTRWGIHLSTLSDRRAANLDDSGPVKSFTPRKALGRIDKKQSPGPQTTGSKY